MRRIFGKDVRLSLSVYGHCSQTFNRLQPSNFVHHLHTILDYLQHRQLLGSPKSRLSDINREAKLRSQYQLFQRYILTATVRKSFARINHAASRSILYLLGSLCSYGNEEFVAWYTNWSQNDAAPKPSIRKDGGLAKQMQLLRRKGETSVKEWLDEAPMLFLKADSDANVTHILTIIDIHVLPGKEGEDLRSHERYRSNTCYGFHLLLVAVLCDYWVALTDFSREPNEGTGSIYLSQANLLWQISQSQIFVYHLEMLAYNSKLVYPDWLKNPTELSKKLKAKKLSTWQNFVDLKDTQKYIGNGEESQARDEIKNSGEEVRNSGGEVKEPESEDEFKHDHAWINFEPGADGVSRQMNDIVENFITWIKALTRPLNAVAILSSFKWPGKIVVLTPFEFELRPETTEMEDWEETIRHVVGPANAAVTIGNIKGLFKNEDLPFKGLAAHFRSYLINPSKHALSFKHPVHCEAALAYSQLTNNPNPINASEFINVSKRCCPVCWDLLAIRNPTRFYARSSHTTLYPVNLPPMITYDDLVRMVQTYSTRLMGLIPEISAEFAGMKKHGLTHKYTPSTESSKSAMSSGSQDTAHSAQEDGMTLRKHKPEQPSMT